MFVDCGSQLKCLEKTHACKEEDREYANSAQKGRSPDFNSEPSRCELTVLTNAPLCCLISPIHKVYPTKYQMVLLE